MENAGEGKTYHKIGLRNLQSGFVGGFFELRIFSDFSKANFAKPNPCAPCFSEFLDPLSWCGLSWLCSASQPFVGSSMVVVCWVDLGVTCIQAGMEGLIRSNGLGQAACTSRSTYGLKSRRKPRPWSGRTLLVLMGRSRSFEFNMCSQEGAKLLVKAWVELMHHLADVWVEARTPLRGWKPVVTEPRFW